MYAMTFEQMMHFKNSAQVIEDQKELMRRPALTITRMGPDGGLLSTVVGERPYEQHFRASVRQAVQQFLMLSQNLKLLVVSDSGDVEEEILNHGVQGARETPVFRDRVVCSWGNPRNYFKNLNNAIPAEDREAKVEKSS